MERKIRLQVALAQLGFASRRAAAKLIKSGRVKVDNQPVFEVGARVALGQDTITVDGKEACVQKKAYFILHKPKDVVTTVKDKHAAKTVLNLVKDKGVRIYPVGRLDKDTTGLLLLTNDGDLAYCLTHPKFNVSKIYHVGINGKTTKGTLQRLEQGIILEGKRTFPCKIKFITAKQKNNELEVTLTEGRKHQIKKMFAAVGHQVLSIKRIAFGPLKLGTIKSGSYRKLKSSELAQLNRLKENLR